MIQQEYAAKRLIIGLTVENKTYQTGMGLDVARALRLFQLFVLGRTLSYRCPLDGAIVLQRTCGRVGP
jgi:hypothetical protein